MIMGGKGRSAGPEMYAGMTPTQEFNARLANVSEHYTPAALRTSNPAAAAAPTTPAPTEPETAPTPVAPSPTESDTIAPVTDGQAPVGKLTTTQDTGNTLARSITAPAMGRDQLNPAAPVGSGGLTLTGQV